MKRIKDIVIFGMLLILAACQQEELTVNGTGTLLLEDLHVQSLQTKAVDTDLYVVIKQNGTLLHSYEPGKVPTSLPLNAGTYQLEIYNQQPTDESVQISAVYHWTGDVTIRSNEINRLEVTIPMVNVGVQLMDDLPSLFSDYQLNITQNGSSRSIAKGEIAYCKAGDPLSYTLSATYQETVQTTEPKTIAAPEAGFIYQIAYTIETKSVTCHMKGEVK